MAPRTLPRFSIVFPSALEHDVEPRHPEKMIEIKLAGGSMGSVNWTGRRSTV